MRGDGMPEIQAGAEMKATEARWQGGLVTLQASFRRAPEL